MAVFGRHSPTRISSGVSNGRKETSEGNNELERARASYPRDTRPDHFRCTPGTRCRTRCIYPYRRDPSCRLADLRRFMVCPWEMAKTTCKESPRNKTTFEYPFSLSSNQPATLFYANPCDSLAPSSPFPYPFWPSSSPFSFFFLIVVVSVGENIEVWKSFCEWKSFFLSENIFPDRYNCGVLLRENIPSFFQNSNFCQKSIHSRLISRLKVIWIKYILILLKVFF